MVKKNLYIINQHYYPELASTAQVFQELAEHFASEGYTVTVIAGLPFYHDNITSGDYNIKELNGVKIKRLWNTTFKKSSFLGKSLNLLTFQVSLLLFLLFRVGSSSIVMAGTNPPLALVSAASAHVFRKFRLVSVIQDLYPDILVSSNYSNGNSLSYKLLSGIMKWSFGRCSSVVTISDDMGMHIKKTYGVKNVRVINNMVIGDIFPINNEKLKKETGLSDKLIVMYSGNFGIAHEYATLLDTVRLLKNNDDIRFRIVGGGINYNAFKEACIKEGLPNIEFHPYVEKEELNRNLNLADVHIVVFNESFKNVLMPSKYYGILACGKPMLLITEGENDILRDIERYGIGCFIKRGNSESLADILQELSRDKGRLSDMSKKAFKLYKDRYDRNLVFKRYGQLLEEL